MLPVGLVIRMWDSRTRRGGRGVILLVQPRRRGCGRSWGHWAAHSTGYRIDLRIGYRRIRRARLSWLLTLREETFETHDDHFDYAPEIDYLKCR